MARFLIAITQEDNQNILKEWFEDRHRCFIPSLDDPKELASIILEMDYDLGFVDETILNAQSESIRKRKLEEYPVILPFIYIKSTKGDESISHLWTIVDDIILTPLKKVGLYMKSQKLLSYRKMTLNLHYMAVTDYLTGFFNYKNLFIIGDQEFQQARRYNRPLSLILMDLDHFRRINDKYGYIIADQVLRSVAQRCYLNIRSADISGRYGGEKFLFILPETSIKSAAITAERLRKIIAEKPIVVEGNSIFVTASFGVVELDKEIKSLNSFLKKAEEALLVAKKKGGNRVEAMD